MTTFAEVLSACGVAREELSLWIERRWVLPLAANGDYVFDEADLARALMIAEFRRELAIDDEAMSLVLALMDQLYATRRRLRQLINATSALSDEQREQLLRRLDAAKADERMQP